MTVSIAEDRSISVPPGKLIKTGYVRVFNCEFACRERMAFGDVKAAFEKSLQLGDHCAWPCPKGHWEGERFVIIDGRHEYIAALMLGKEYILVAWLE